MSTSSIGIQMIEPKTATSPKSPPTAPHDRDRENAAFTSQAVTHKAPTAPGTGKLVDKTA